MVGESIFNPVTQPSAGSNTTQYTGSSDAQYFQTAQMKLHAREQRLQVLNLPLKTIPTVCNSYCPIKRNICGAGRAIAHNFSSCDV